MLEKLPQTVCHNDTYPTNFISHDLPNGQQQTIALDWALAGIAPVGADLGQLVFGAQKNLKEISHSNIDTALFESYLAGLKDSGCKIEHQAVRFGYTTYAALQVGLFMFFWLSRELENNEVNVEEAIKQPAQPICFEVVMANEAYKIVDVL